MIPKIIHYIWFGSKPLTPLAEDCLASWKEQMSDWQIMRWDESNFDIAAAPRYVKQAYEARKFAFVSDYVRLWALEQYGGLYMDVDFMVFRPFDELMDKYPAFAGYEGSKRQPVMQGVIASEPHGAWVRDMLGTYEHRTFVKEDGSLDMTPNTGYFTDRLEAQGFVADGVEKDFYLLESTKTQINTVPAINIEKGEVTPNVDCINQEKNSHTDGGIFMLHVFPVHYFCPVLTTGEDVRTEETYCEHKGESSWAQQTWKGKLLSKLPSSLRTKLIKLKRKIFG